MVPRVDRRHRTEIEHAEAGRDRAFKSEPLSGVWISADIAEHSALYRGEYGYTADPQTGLILAGRRYYSPLTHRWLNRDPIGYAGGMNLYEYAGDDPVNEVDPSGEEYFGNWIDSELLGGAISNWGSAQGEADSGKISKGRLAWAAANGSVQTVLLAGSIVDGYGIARAGVRLIGEKLAESAAAKLAGRIAAENAAKMAGVRAAGVAGEAAAGIVKNTTHIDALVSGASYRIPDVLDKTMIGEVKNVSVLSYSKQMADFVAFARQEGLPLKYYVRSGTKLAPKVQALVSAGAITIVRALK